MKRHPNRLPTCQKVRPPTTCSYCPRNLWNEGKESPALVASKASSGPKFVFSSPLSVPASTQHTRTSLSFCGIMKHFEDLMKMRGPFSGKLYMCVCRHVHVCTRTHASVCISSTSPNLSLRITWAASQIMVQPLPTLTSIESLEKVSQSLY